MGTIAQNRLSGSEQSQSCHISQGNKIVTVPVAYLGMVTEELPGGHSPPAVGMGGFHVPALGAIREQEGEVERHGTGVEVRHTLETSSPDLDHQVHVFHKNKKIRQNIQFLWLGHKIPNWLKPQTYLQPKFHSPS